MPVNYKGDPREYQINVPQWPHGFITVQEADFGSINYITAYLDKSAGVERRKQDGHVQFAVRYSRNPELGGYHTVDYARRTAEAGLPLQGWKYQVAGYRKKKTDSETGRQYMANRDFYFRGRARERYVNEYIWHWRSLYRCDPPFSGRIDRPDPLEEWQGRLDAEFVDRIEKKLRPEQRLANLKSDLDGFQVEDRPSQYVSKPNKEPPDGYTVTYERASRRYIARCDDEGKAPLYWCNQYGRYDWRDKMRPDRKKDKRKAAYGSFEEESKDAWCVSVPQVEPPKGYVIQGWFTEKAVWYAYNRAQIGPKLLYWHMDEDGVWGWLPEVRGKPPPSLDVRAAAQEAYRRISFAESAIPF